MKSNKNKSVIRTIQGVVLIALGLIALIWFYTSAPYCATHICGCTGMGEQWGIVHPLGVISIVLGFVLLVDDIIMR